MVRHATVVLLVWLAAISSAFAQPKQPAKGAAAKGVPGTGAPPAAAIGPAPAPAPAAAPVTPSAGAGTAAGKIVQRITPPMNFDKLSYADGLPNSHVQAIVQDRLGFIWFGTQDGLARYDGSRMRVYRHSETDATTLSGGYITALMLDSAGKLWVGTDEKGANHYDPDTDTFTRYVQGDKGGLSSPGITAILKDKKDRVWFAMSGGGLNRFDPATKTFVEYVSAPLDVSITALDVDANGNLWLGTAGEGIIRWNPDDGSTESFKPGETQGVPAAPINAVLSSSSGLIWIGSEGEGLVSFDAASRKLLIYSHSPTDPTTISDDHVTTLFEDKNKQIWIGTQNGLNRMDATGAVSQFRHDPNDPLSLSFPGVESIFQDSSGMMWVGGFTVGACKFEESRSAFGRYRTRTHVANSFFEDPDGTLWVGTYHGGLYRYDWKTRDVTIYMVLGTAGSDGAIAFESDWITSLHRDRKGTLWIATQAQGLIGFDSKTETYKQYLPDPDSQSSLPVQTIWDVWEDEAGMLWLATWAGGLVKFDPGLQTFKTFTTQDSIGLTSNHLYVLYPDPADKKILWIGSAGGGVMRFDMTAGTATSFQNKPEDPTSLSSNHVLTIVRDAAGALWVGTYGNGLNKLDPATGKSQRFTASNSGLTNDVIWGLLPDDEGNLWISTNGGGLLQYEPKTNKFIVYTTSDGVQSNEFGQGGFMRNSAGKLYFGGDGGFNAFVPKEITRDSKAPAVVLTALTMFNQEVKLPRPIWNLPTINVTYSDSFEIQFAALSFAAPKQNRFSFKLEGFDDKWTETDRPYTTYTKLDGGSYTLRVRAANRHGVWNETGVKLKIAVKPPFYRTWPAYGIYLMLLVGAVFLVVYFQRQRVRRVIRDGRLAVVERDLALTGAVQNGFLPEYNEITGGRVQLFGFYRGADSCSGDWWWHETIGNRHLVLVGDVTGHGPGPAMVTAAVASAFRLLVTETGIGDLLDALLVLNRVVLQVAKGKYSMTMAAFELDELTGQWVLYNAGAPPMMTLSANGKHRVHFAAGTPLGTESGFEAGRLEGRLQPQERVLIYTDGIPEIMLPSGQALGMRRLGQMYERTRQQELRDAASAIVQQADLTQSGKPQDDDWTFAVVEWRGGAGSVGVAAARDMGEYGGG